MSQVKLIVFAAIIALTVQSSNSASISSEPTCVCTREYLPICGSDFNTYSNMCLFQCEKKRKTDLEIKFYGECEEDIRGEDLPRVCLCKMIYEPVCGTDPKTYSSICELSCAQRNTKGLRVKHEGVCRQEIEVPQEITEIEHKCVCTLEYMPICGSNGQTFANKCELDCENKFTRTHIDIRHTGECNNEIENLPLPLEVDYPCVCPLIYSPVCGNDQKTYSSVCELECAKHRSDKSLQVKHQGECELDYCICTQEYMPVCGSDSVTYGNSCHFRCVQRQRTDIRIVRSGECN